MSKKTEFSVPQYPRDDFKRDNTQGNFTLDTSGQIALSDEFKSVIGRLFPGVTGKLFIELNQGGIRSADLSIKIK